MSRYWYRNQMIKHRAEAQEVEAPEETPPEDDNIVPFEDENEPPTEPEENPEEEPAPEEENGDEEENTEN